MKVYSLLAAVLLFSACTKDEPAPSVEERLRGNWKQSAGKVTYFYAPTQLDTTVEYFKDGAKCYKDDVLTLKAGYLGEVFYGAVACTPSEQQINPLTWQVRNNDTTLEIDNSRQFFYGANPMRGSFQGEIGNTFTVRYAVDSIDQNGRPLLYTFTNTYAKQ